VRLALFFVLAGCAAPRPPAPPPAAKPDPAAVRAEALEILRAVEAGFPRHGGSVELDPAFARFRADHVPALRELADGNRPGALGALRVLARLAPSERFSAEAKAILYATALREETDFSRWGLISPSGFLPGVHGRELLELKGASAPYLRPLLADRRRAKIAGSEVNRIQGDRVCDYAWIFLAEVFDRPLSYAPDPSLRDPQIREMDAWLEARKTR
jgi:hypothetical protein